MVKVGTELFSLILVISLKTCYTGPEVNNMDFQHEKGRIFALDADGKLLAEVTFPTENGVATITHTFVDDSLRGQGVASQILAEAAEQIRASGLRMNATCRVAAKWIAKHTEFSDLTTAP